MICGSLLVFFLSRLTLGVLSETIERNVTCGEDIEIHYDCNEILTSDPNRKIDSMQLRRSNSPFLEVPNVTIVDRNCSKDGQICLMAAKDRKRATLTMRGVTFTDQGKYDLRCRRSDGEARNIIIYVFVYGVCDPIIFPSEDELTCEVTMENNTYEPTINWMSKATRLNESKREKNATDNYIKWRITLKLTDETRQMEMCCTVSDPQSKREEKQTCLPFTAGSYKLNEDTNRTQIMIPILCVLVLAIAIALYVYHRRRPSFTRPRRERTDSEQGLISELENPQEENKKETQLDPLQGPKDKV